MIQEVLDGKHQLWEDQMCKKHGIDNVRDYLPSFRNHVIANAKMNSVSDINSFKQYFNVAFSYFTKSQPIETLNRYYQIAKADDYRKYCEWVINNVSNVAHGIQPLDEDEFRKLKEVYGFKQSSGPYQQILFTLPDSC